MRKPRFWSRLPGGMKLRFAERAPLVSPRHDPPRCTRNEPVDGPKGSRSPSRLAAYPSFVHSLTFPNTVFRIMRGNGAHNVASLQVRHRTTWQPTVGRGVPVAVAEQFVGPLRFLWEQHAPYSQSWYTVRGTSDHVH
jgi:hypothetical protein